MADAGTVTGVAIQRRCAVGVVFALERADQRCTRFVAATIEASGIPAPKEGEGKAEDKKGGK